jgi:hypothetical protein
LEYALCDFPGDLGDAGLQILFRGGSFRGNAIFGGGYFRGGFRACLFQEDCAFVEDLLALGFLLGIDLGVRLPQSLLVLLDLFSGGGLRGFGSLFGANGARFPFGHHLEQGLKEKKAKDKIENQDDQGYRHSPEEQFAYLVNQF